MSAKTTSFVEQMVLKFPNLAPMLKDHIEANLGEILPHPFMGEVTEYLELRSPTSNSSSERDLREMLKFFEESYVNGNDEVQNLIAVSFLENLPREGQQGDFIRKLVGPNLPNLKKQLDAFR